MNGSKKDSGFRILVKGTVQGVGFRPFVYNLASSLGIKGFVTNTASGVEIEAEGENAATFIERIKREAPPLSEITSVEVNAVSPKYHDSFTIKKSDSDGSVNTFIPPDAALCRDCNQDIYDRRDRHYQYPFTNCTNCGPRYSITRAIPYDRRNTTMSAFKMCRACRKEYDDPGDRRFHAQPNACPKCGPKLELRVSSSGFKAEKIKEPLEAAIRMLQDGKIVALKGIGGFHIACDAMNPAAVAKLRERKQRKAKPFAIMCPDIETASLFGDIDRQSEAFLLSPEAPVVLLKKKEGSGISELVSPDNPYIGVMLPYSPLHHLLFFHPDDARPAFKALVMTSGNISEEPIIRDNEEAIKKLGKVCDAFLLHNRGIQTRLDDSLIHVIGSRPSVIRRSRGYAPRPVRLPFSVPPLLACGPELKSTFTLAKGDAAITSQHLGDLDSYETLSFFEETLANLKTVFDIEPENIFYDMHPDYIATKWAKERNLPGFAVQHHEAHIAACIVENNLEGDVIGIALDGTGFGRDGNIWGGEIFTGNLGSFARVGRLRYIPMPGGEAAIKEPWRMAASCLMTVSGDNLDYVLERWRDFGAETIADMIKKNVGSPLTSSCGRLFDAAASLIAGFDRASFEAEAAIGLESLVRSKLQETYFYDIIIKDGMVEIDFMNAFNDIISDMKRNNDKNRAAAIFHNTIASGITEAAAKTASSCDLKRICLSGGVFQNRIFTELLVGKLKDAGLKVFTHRLLPPNDGCISFGQAVLGGWRVRCA